MKHPKSLKVVFAALAVSMVPLFGSCSNSNSERPVIGDQIPSALGSTMFFDLQMSRERWQLPDELPERFSIDLTWVWEEDSPIEVGSLQLRPEFDAATVSEERRLVVDRIASKDFGVLETTDSGQLVAVTELRGGMVIGLLFQRYPTTRRSSERGLYGQSYEASGSPYFNNHLGEWKYSIYYERDDGDHHSIVSSVISPYAHPLPKKWDVGGMSAGSSDSRYSKLWGQKLDFIGDPRTDIRYWLEVSITELDEEAEADVQRRRPR